MSIQVLGTGSYVPEKIVTNSWVRENVLPYVG